LGSLAQRFGVQKSGRFETFPVILTDFTRSGIGRYEVAQFVLGKECLHVFDELLLSRVAYFNFLKNVLKNFVKGSEETHEKWKILPDDFRQRAFNTSARSQYEFGAKPIRLGSWPYRKQLLILQGIAKLQTEPFWRGDDLESNLARIGANAQVRDEQIQKDMLLMLCRMVDACVHAPRTWFVPATPGE
jgi:hypothetical protein